MYLHVPVLWSAVAQCFCVVERGSSVVECRTHNHVLVLWSAVAQCSCVVERGSSVVECRTHNHVLVLWSAVAQCSCVVERGSSAVECRTHNQVSPGSNSLYCRFEEWAFPFSPRRLSSLSCINEYLASGYRWWW